MEINSALVPAKSPGSGRNTKVILCVQRGKEYCGIKASIGVLWAPFVQGDILDIAKRTLLSVLIAWLAIHKWWWENVLKW